MTALALDDLSFLPASAGSGSVAAAKAMIGDDVCQMLRLTRELLRPSNDVDTAAAALADVMKQLAPRIREAEAPEVMRAAIDEIILEELRARYDRAEFCRPAEEEATTLPNSGDSRERPASISPNVSDQQPA